MDQRERITAQVVMSFLSFTFTLGFNRFTAWAGIRKLKGKLIG